MYVVQSTTSLTQYAVLYAWDCAITYTRHLRTRSHLFVTAVITKMENKIHQLQLQAVNELTLQFCFIQLFIVIARAHILFQYARTHSVSFAFID